MTVHEDKPGNEAGTGTRGPLTLALVSALLFLVPLALARLPLLHLLLAWGALLLVYVAILRLFGLRSVIEVGLFVLLMSTCVAGVLWLSLRAPRPAGAQHEPGGESAAPARPTPAERMRRPSDE